MRLHATGLHIRYGRRSVVHGVDLAAAPGEILTILGANGSGKSTLLRALAGLLPHGGTVQWDGDAHAIGYMPQDNAIRAALTAFEVVLLGRLRSLTLRVGAADVDAASAAMAELGIAAFAARRIGELSGGQRQLVFMAQILAGNPRALLLDEPTSALDISHQLHVLALLRDITRRRGLTTLAVLHDLNAAARFADRIALMQHGRLIAIGTPAEILTRDTLRQAYGIEVSVQPGPGGAPVIIPLHVA
jgi:iron complex transport system ATP-binding protein